MAWQNNIERLSISERTAAVDAGRSAGIAMTEAIAEYTGPQFMHFRRVFLETLRSQLQISLRQSETSPVACANQKFDVFRDQVAVLQVKLEDDAAVKLADCFAAADQIGVGEGVREILRKRLNIFGMELLVEGKSVFDEYAVALRDADAAWQHNN